MNCADLYDYIILIEKWTRSRNCFTMRNTISFREKKEKEINKYFLWLNNNF